MVLIVRTTAGLYIPPFLEHTREDTREYELRQLLFRGDYTIPGTRYRTILLVKMAKYKIYTWYLVPGTRVGFVYTVYVSITGTSGAFIRALNLGSDMCLVFSIEY